MTYLKTLIALTGLVLITACAGGVTINPVVNNGEPKTTDPCVTNPFGTGCAVPTDMQRVTFCRDNTKTTDTKPADCAPVAISVCNGNVFDTLCPTDPTEPQQEAFCRDETKMTDTKTADCAPAVMRVCGDNIFDTICTNHATEQLAFCRDDTKTSPTKPADCANTLIRVCNANAFDSLCTSTPTQEAAFCRDDTKTTDTKPADCADTITRVCGANIHDSLCDGITEYEDLRTAELMQCTSSNTPEFCDAQALMTRCTGNPFTQECEADYGDLRKSTCASEINEPRCMDTVALVCNADKFDAYCAGADAYLTDQLSECADATATTAQCNMVFTGNLAGCLADPFSVACDTEPTFTDRVSVRKKRFDFCETDQTSDVRCTGYTTCNISVTFAPLTCGTDFNPKRMEFCMTTANAFDPLCVDNNLADTTAQMAHCMVTTQAFDAGCVDNLKNAEAQLNFCKLLGTNPFTGNCAGADFKDARVAFCLRGTNAMTNQDCKNDVLAEGLVPASDVCEEQMASASCANAAALPTYPTLPEETSPTAGDAFANGFLKVAFIAPTDGTPLLNPDGTDNTTIDTTNFPANTRLVSVEVPTVGFTPGIPAPKFGRRGGLGSSDADGFVWFFILKGADGTEESQRSHHATILPTTNLGAPLTEPPMTAVWPGHFYYNSSVPDPTDFFITFESGLASNQIGRIGFANPVGSTPRGIGTGADRPQFAKDQGLELNMVAVNPEDTLSVTFDAKGVISGQIRHAYFGDPALVTGLIGQEGFVAISIIRSSFAGFTATNPDGGAIPSVDACIADPNSCFVTYTDWADATTPVPITSFTTSQFASTRATTLKKQGVSGLVDIFTNLNTAKFDEVALGGDATNGFIVIPNRGSNFAGIASTTNLGDPLGAQPTGTWNGSFQVYEDGAPTLVPSDFTLTVTYGGSNLGSGKTGSLSATIANTDYSFVGEFNASGVIDGTVTHTDATNSTGPLQGLIGADGAVGVFISSPSQTQSFGGGFVACPYDTVAKTCMARQ